MFNIEILYSSLKILYFLNVDYKHNTSFKWSNKKRYDFYIPNKKTIIEIHGKQHFARGFENLGGKTLQEEIDNDKYKRNLRSKTFINS